MMSVREPERNPAQARRQPRGTDLNTRGLVTVVSLGAVMGGLAATLLIQMLG